MLVQLGARGVGRIPIVDRSSPKHLLGILRRHDIIGAYTKVIARQPRHQVSNLGENIKWSGTILRY